MVLYGISARDLIMIRMIASRFFTVLLFGLAFAKASAQDNMAEGVDGQNSNPIKQENTEIFSYDGQSWHELVGGKTLYYSYKGRVVGREYYDPESNKAVFIYFNGNCYEGNWYEQNGIFCFNYGGMHCFEHFEKDGQIIARGVGGDDQIVVKFTDEILSCDPEFLSRLEQDWFMTRSKQSG